MLVCGRTVPASLPDGIEFVQADVRDPGQAVVLAQTAIDRFGRLDVLINNAGGAPPADAATASPRFHAKIIELNLTAPLHVSQAANAVMQTSGRGGSIIMISSVSGTRPSPGTAAYGAAKAGLTHLAVSLAHGMGTQGQGQHRRSRPGRHRGVSRPLRRPRGDGGRGCQLSRSAGWRPRKT